MMLNHLLHHMFFHDQGSFEVLLLPAAKSFWWWCDQHKGSLVKKYLSLPEHFMYKCGFANPLIVQNIY